MKADDKLTLLKHVMRDGILVRFRRRYEESSIHGYVLDVGPRFFLLALVSDRIRFDGFECFRIADISKLEPDPHAAFVEQALQMRGEAMPENPQIEVASLNRLLVSANRASPLVTIHRERVDPDVCHIGCVVALRHGKLSLLEITPDATWDDLPTDYRLSEITRVNFGGDYEGALHLVGGEPRPSVRTSGA